MNDRKDNDKGEAGTVGRFTPSHDTKRSYITDNQNQSAINTADKKKENKTLLIGRKKVFSKTHEKEESDIGEDSHDIF